MIYVLNGGEPSKVRLFSNLNGYTLLDNNGDNYNADNLIKLLYKGGLEPEDYIVITSEDQLTWIINNSNLATYYDQLIYTKSSKYNLINKSVLTRVESQESIPQVVTITSNTKLPDYPVVVKPLIGSGSRSVVTNGTLGKVHTNKNPLSEFNIGDKVLVQMACKPTLYDMWTVPTIVREGQLVDYIPLRYSGDINKIGSSRWEAINLDTSKMYTFREILLDIINALHITEGIFEPEIAINKFNDKYNIIDGNFRYSYDNSVVCEVLSQIGMHYNMVEVYLDKQSPVFPSIANEKYNIKYKLTDSYLRVN